MGLYLNPGNEEFRNAAIHSKIYVDKTEMIKFTNSQLFGEHKNICVSRPRRFGKSMAANMLVAYYSKGCDSADIFADYEISHAGDFRQHLNKHDVIHLDIQWCLAPAKGAAGVVSYIEKSVIAELKEKYPDIILMADISNYEEGINAWKCGVDIVGTTMSGYTAYTSSVSDGPDYELMERLSRDINIPVIGEGRIHYPDQAVKALQTGAWAIVVGGAITRPLEIAMRFQNAIKESR